MNELLQSATLIEVQNQTLRANTAQLQALVTKKLSALEQAVRERPLLQIEIDSLREAADTIDEMIIATEDFAELLQELKRELGEVK